MDKGLENTWKILAEVVKEHAWLAVPIAFLAVLAYQLPSLTKACLDHRKEMWQLRNAERRRRENVENRARKALAKRDKHKP